MLTKRRLFYLFTFIIVLLLTFYIQSDGYKINSMIKKIDYIGLNNYINANIKNSKNEKIISKAIRGIIEGKEKEELNTLEKIFINNQDGISINTKKEFLKLYELNDLEFTNPIDIFSIYYDTGINNFTEDDRYRLASILKKQEKEVIDFMINREFYDNPFNFDFVEKYFPDSFATIQKHYTNIFINNISTEKDFQKKLSITNSIDIENIGLDQGELDSIINNIKIIIEQEEKKEEKTRLLYETDNNIEILDESYLNDSYINLSGYIVAQLENNKYEFAFLEYDSYLGYYPSKKRGILQTIDTTFTSKGRFELKTRYLGDESVSLKEEFGSFQQKWPFYVELPESNLLKIINNNKEIDEKKETLHKNAIDLKEQLKNIDDIIKNSTNTLENIIDEINNRNYLINTEISVKKDVDSKSEKIKFGDLPDDIPEYLGLSKDELIMIFPNKLNEYIVSKDGNKIYSSLESEGYKFFYNYDPEVDKNKVIDSIEINHTNIKIRNFSIGDNINTVLETFPNENKINIMENESGYLYGTGNHDDCAYVFFKDTGVISDISFQKMDINNNFGEIMEVLFKNGKVEKIIYIDTFFQP